MRPNIYFVYDSERGLRHRAFSMYQPAFCGRVSSGPRWEHIRSSASERERKCRECAESPLNGEVALIETTYVPQLFAIDETSR